MVASASDVTVNIDNCSKTTTHITNMTNRTNFRYSLDVFNCKRLVACWRCVRSSLFVGHRYPLKLGRVVERGSAIHFNLRSLQSLSGVHLTCFIVFARTCLCCCTLSSVCSVLTGAEHRRAPRMARQVAVRQESGRPDNTPHVS
jgi:hypothetical protein